jgi:hypothetical protein
MCERKCLGRILLLGLCFVVIDAGCSGRDDEPLSRLRGKWYVTELTRTFSSEDGVRTEEFGSDQSQAYVVIRPDGTFDLSRTMLSGIEGFEHLRRSGDRVYLETDHDANKDSGYLEVRSAEYTPTHSEFILRAYFGTPGEWKEYVFRAQLDEDGHLSYENSMHGRGTSTASEGGMLVRGAKDN